VTQLRPTCAQSVSQHSVSTSRGKTGHQQPAKALYLESTPGTTRTYLAVMRSSVRTPPGPPTTHMILNKLDQQNRPVFRGHDLMHARHEIEGLNTFGFPSFFSKLTTLLPMGRPHRASRCDRACLGDRSWVNEVIAVRARFSRPLRD
jgi:hypothetical protein